MPKKTLGSCPSTWVKVAPPSVLRNKPADGPGKMLVKFEAARSVLPRMATALMFWPSRIGRPELGTTCPARTVKVGVAAVALRVRSRPARTPPSSKNELKLPNPASSVLAVASPRSRAIAPIDRDGWKSVSGVQLGLAAVALVVRQMPPLTAPTKKTLAFDGCGTTTWIAPATLLLGGRFSTCASMFGAGPSANHVATKGATKGCSCSWMTLPSPSTSTLSDDPHADAKSIGNRTPIEHASERKDVFMS
jgi:hypothetical protein